MVDAGKESRRSGLQGKVEAKVQNRRRPQDKGKGQSTVALEAHSSLNFIP